MKRLRASGVCTVILAAAAVAACHGAETKGPQVAARPAPAAPTCAGASSAEPLTKGAPGGAIVLARVAGRRVAYVADEDAKAILTFDLDAQKQIAETPLGGAPAQVWVARDGRVLATVRDRAELVALGATKADAPLTKLCAVKTAPEPIAIAATADEATVLVSSGWGRTLAALDAQTLTTRFTAPLAREPRAVVVSDDGRTAFVSHAVGSVLSAVDLGGDHQVSAVSMNGFDVNTVRALDMRRHMLATRPEVGDLVDPEGLAKLEKGRPSCQGFALAKSAAVPGRIFAPEVIVDPGDPEQRPDGYGDDGRPTEMPAVAVVDEGKRAPLRASVTTNPMVAEMTRGRNARDAQPECLLPRAAVIDADTRSLLVTCFGIDAVMVYDAAAANPLAAERRRWDVGAGPSGVAVDGEKRRAVVWSQFDRTISSFPLLGGGLVDEKATPQRATKTSLPALREKLPAEYALGRVLFHAAGDPRVADDGRACASCHPDGRDDGLTWATPDGPRRSILLAGRAATSAPYSWSGGETTLHDHLASTFDRLKGKGLRNLELDALVAYVSKMPAPEALPPVEPAAVARGRAIFTSREAACSTCHTGDGLRDGRSHDVGSRHKADRDGTFDTPSLHLVGGAGPWFHDGRYATLTELFRATDGKMGHTAHLSKSELADLESFVRSL